MCFLQAFRKSVIMAFWTTVPKPKTWNLSSNYRVDNVSGTSMPVCPWQNFWKQYGISISVSAPYVVAKAWSLREGLMQDSAKTLFLFSGLPREGLRSMPRIIFTSHNSCIISDFPSQKQLWRHSEKKQSPYSYRLKFRGLVQLERIIFRAALSFVKAVLSFCSEYDTFLKNYIISSCFFTL